MRLRLQQFCIVGPLIAAVWNLTLARLSHAPPVASTVCLLLASWSVYLADRWLDARTGDVPRGSQRHALFLSHPRAMTALLASVLGVALSTSLWLLPAPVLAAGAGLAAATAAYLWMVHHGGFAAHNKEAMVGALFATGTFIPSACRPGAGFARLVLPWAAFAVLCALNCILCEWTERVDNPAPRQRDLAQLAGPRIPALAAIFAVLAATLFFVQPSPLLPACSISALLLAAIALRDRALAPETSRFLADLALLTPVCLWLV